MVVDKTMSNFDLNDETLKEMSEKCNIFETRDIKKNTTIKQLFKDSGHCVFFHRWNKNNEYAVGHWVVCTRRKENGKMLYIFWDSLGMNINVYSKYLINILKKKGDILYINTHAYQGKTSCCGKWCLFMIAMNKKHIDPNNIIKFLEDGKKKYKTYDNFILNLIK